MQPVVFQQQLILFMERSEKATHATLHPRSKKSIETNETLNDGLPALQLARGERANVLRGQLNDARSQIQLMEAKLRNLRHQRDRHELNNQRNLTRIDFMNGVKHRAQLDRDRKEKAKQERAQSLETLRQEAGARREALAEERRNAEQQLLAVRVNDAEEERKRHKQQEYLIHKLKEMESLEKGRKVERIREFHQTSSSRLRDFQESRIAFSKDNYKQKVVSTMKEKERAKQVLEQLRQEEERLLADVKHSEQAMLTSLYSLETINPQHRKRFRSDRTKPASDRHKDEDYYSHESFDA